MSTFMSLTKTVLAVGAAAILLAPVLRRYGLLPAEMDDDVGSEPSSASLSSAPPGPQVVGQAATPTPAVLSNGSGGPQH